MRQLTEEETKKLISNLVSYLMKEIDAPCSSDSHFLTAILILINAFDENELNELPINGTGADALKQYVYFSKILNKHIPNKYFKFLDFK